MKKILILFVSLCFCVTLFAQKKIKVACVGNSITYGYTLPDREINAYPAKLQKMLGDDYVVGNFGKSGATLLNKGHRPYMQQEEYHKAIDFADIIGIGKDQLSRIENGKVPCKMEYLFTISLTLEVSTDYLIFGKDIGNDLESIARIVGNDKIKLTKIKTIAEVVYGE